MLLKENLDIAEAISVGGNMSEDKKPSDYYFTDVEWARTVGYGNVPADRIKPQEIKENNDE